MYSGVLRTICRVGIFMICAQTIVNFRPKGSYEKYLRLLMGGMILIQLLTPVVKLFGDDTGFEAQLAEFDERLEMGIYNFTSEAAEAEDKITDVMSDNPETDTDINIEIDTGIEPVEINIEPIE
jgi:hypothetical protein